MLINLTQYYSYSIKVSNKLNFSPNFSNCCRELIWFARLHKFKKINMFNLTNNLDEEPYSIIESSKIFLNNLSITDNIKSKFYNFITSFYNHKGGGNIGINSYNFDFNSENIQPNGSVNLVK